MPVSFVLNDGLAVYRVGAGEPALLFPYPHGSTLRPMAEDKLAALLAGLGRQVITFDPPGAYRSTRTMRCDMAEMLACAEEALQVCHVEPPLDVIGHSMGSLCALGLAIERPELVCRLVLIGSLSGWPAVLRWSTPHNWSPWRDREWWQCIWLGTRQMLGLGRAAWPSTNGWTTWSSKPRSWIRATSSCGRSIPATQNEHPRPGRPGCGPCGAWTTRHGWAM